MATLLPNVRRFVELADLAQRIRDSNGTWETKYDIIFSDDISGAVRATSIDVDWVDPDTTYEDDVCAYVAALMIKAIDLRHILASVDDSAAQADFQRTATIVQYCPPAN